MKKEITTIRINKKTKDMFKKLKKYPRETDEETFIRMIKSYLSGECHNDTKKHN